MRQQYERLKQQQKKEDVENTLRDESKRADWEAEELLKRQPNSPLQFSSQNEKKLRVLNAVNMRIENSRAELQQKHLQQRKEFLLRATHERTQEKPAKSPLTETDRQKLKDSFSRAADRRQPRDHDRGRGRDGR